MGSELYRRTLDDECMVCEWSSLGGGPHEGCSSHGVWTEESYSPATPADLVAHVSALPADEAQALLVALPAAVLLADPRVAALVDALRDMSGWVQPNAQRALDAALAPFRVTP